MNRQTFRFLKCIIASLAFFFVNLLFTSDVFAQQTTSNKPATNLSEYEDQVTIGYMRANGATEETINRWIKDHKEARNKLTGMFQNPNYQDPAHKNPVVSAVGTCADMGGENGWGAWQASTGYMFWPTGGPSFNLVGCTYPPPSPFITRPMPWDITNASPTAITGISGPRFDLTSAGTNSCTPGPKAGAPLLPLVAPGFGSHSIQIGEAGMNGNGDFCDRVTGPGGAWAGGGCAERLTYNLLVTPADTNFTYAYAVVLENPCTPFSPHKTHQVDYAEIYVLEPNGIDTVPCTHHKYVGDTLGNCKPTATSTMWEASCAGSGGAGGLGYDVAYQPWTLVTLNLAAYVGKVVQVVITNVDCSLGVHYCYSYWDFKCSPPTSNTIPFCAGQQTTISGPASPGSTYAWFQNHHGYTGTPSATSQNITPIPVLGDTFDVDVIQASGCKYRMTFVPEPSSVSPAYTYTVGCGKVAFTDKSTVVPASASNSIVAWDWQLPGGTPATSTSQNPGTVTYAPGTYTASLIVTSTAGCTDTIKQTFTITGLQSSMNQTNVQCGSPGSASITIAGGTPAYTYSWNNGATTSTATNLVAGDYSVTVADATGCTASNTVTITSVPNIVANVNNSTICAGQNAVLTASGGTDYLWNNGATTSSISVAPAASSVYVVFVSSGACKDTAYANVSVTPSPSLNLGNDLTICTVQPVTLDAGSTGATSYIWSNGASTQTIEVSGPGSYWVIASLNNCLAKDTVSISLAPTVQLSDSNLCTVSPIVLDPGAGATSYLWSDGSTTQTISVQEAGEFWVVVLFGTCLSTDSATITGDGTGGTLYVPNAFTPNDDEVNEVFMAKGTGIATFDMDVFDRWGNLLFTSNNINTGWSGKIQKGHYPLKNNGREPSEEDVYVWKIDYTTQCFPNQVKKAIGTVSIIK